MRRFLFLIIHAQFTSVSQYPRTGNYWKILLLFQFVRARCHSLLEDLYELSKRNNIIYLQTFSYDSEVKSIISLSTPESSSARGTMGPCFGSGDLL
jgi:hypothetical protein